MFCTARSVCSRTVDTPTDNLQGFPFIHLFVAGHNNIHHPLPSAPVSLTHKRDLSTIFSNLHNILAAFPLLGHTDKPSDFFEKNLSYRPVRRCLQYCPTSAVSPLSASVHSFRLAVTQPTRQQIIYKTAFPSTCRLLTVWTFKYEHNLSVNMHIVCYSDAGSALNETKVI